MGPFDRLEGELEQRGVYVEPRDTHPLIPFLGGSAGGIAAHVVARAAGFGPLGVAVSILGGAVLGHFAASHRLRCEPPPAEDRPPSPAGWSDRR